jgi:hypothetical protein
MPAHRWISVALACPLAAAACAGSTVPTAVGPPLELDLGHSRYTCESPDGFTPSLVDTPARAESEDHPSAAALRTALEGGIPGPDILPDSGHWLVSRDASTAYYMAQARDGSEHPFVNVSLSNGVDGWELTGWGDCHPAMVLDELSLVRWPLDPASPQPAAGTTELTALVTEWACTCGAPVIDRLLAPSITFGSDAISIVFAARPLAGLVTCPGIAPARVGVQLREDVGDRVLLDAGVFPAADPSDPAF